MEIQVRDGKAIIDGYVNAVERFSKPLRKKNGDKFIERIMPSVFRRAIEKNKSIKVLLNHDYDRELANTRDGTASLYEDNIGLRAKVETSDPDVVEKAEAKKLRGWSFGFILNKADEVKNADGLIERTVRDIDLIEVSILDETKIPAYIGTSIEMRDGEVELKPIEIRDEEFENNSFSNEEKSPENTQENFESMTASQKREILNGAYKQSFENGWLEDYDETYVYGTIKEDGTIYKMPYTITDGVVSIDTSNQVKVVRGGYKEVREDGPKQQPKKEVEKIDYSQYRNRIKKIKEEKKYE